MCGVLGISCNNCPKERQERPQVFHRLMTCGNDISQRGERAWGILTSSGEKMSYHRQEGRFAEGITEKRAGVLASRLQGSVGLAHALYSTTGRSGQKKQPKSIQPRMSVFNGKPFGMSYNGNIYDLSQLRARAKAGGWKFKSKSSDTEVIVALISTSKKTDFIEVLKEVLPLLKGAFALVFLYDGKIIGVRDQCGIRPLCIGSSEDSYILSSESCVFHSVGAKFFRDVRPGEIVVIGEKGVEKSIKWIEETCCKFCIFEFVYFARPDSRLCKGRSAYYYRNKAGIILAKEAPVKADLIISVPSGGDIFAEAYASELGIPFRQGIFKNRFGIRTFMMPRGTDRRKAQRIKLHPLSEVLWGKSVCLVDDSIVRLNACPEIVAMCFEAGATEVHVRIGSSPIFWPCYYAIDMATRKELAAANHTVEEMRELIGCDSLAYISLQGMIEATGLSKENLCMACFDGNYPVLPPVEI